MAKIFSNQALKGFYDWAPEEFRLRKYIFSNWRQVCRRFAFEEYLTPILENADIYRAKSGEDVGLTELMVFTDQANRELALRPEMTPSITRLVSGIYDSSPKPLRLFSIANFVRNQRPQRGRNREFWQLNCDIFGSDNINTEIEMLSLALELVLVFNPPKDSFIVGISHRKLLDDLFSLLQIKIAWRLNVSRVMDKFSKLRPADFVISLEDIGLDRGQIDGLTDFMTSDSLDKVLENFPDLKESEALKDLRQVFISLDNLNYRGYFRFQPDVIRGFDYYDGLVFEVFDRHPENRRAMFGGGRYNGLAELFGKKSFPAFGFAPGDETFKLFLEVWGLLPIEKEDNDKRFFLPLLDASLATKSLTIAANLRAKGYLVESGLETMKIAKALEYANRKGITKVVLFGSDEESKGVYQLKDLASGEQITHKI